MFVLAAAGLEEDSCHFSSVTTLERMLQMPVSAVLNASLRSLLQLFLRPLSSTREVWRRESGLRAWSRPPWVTHFFLSNIPFTFCPTLHKVPSSFLPLPLTKFSTCQPDGDCSRTVVVNLCLWKIAAWIARGKSFRFLSGHRRVRQQLDKLRPADWKVTGGMSWVTRHPRTDLQRGKRPTWSVLDILCS